MSNWKILAEHYQSLESEVREVAIAIPISTARLQIVAVASLAKNFEFNLYVTSQPSNSSSFFLQPTLRGLCEDVINLKYLIEQVDSADAEALITSWMSQQTSESIEKQENFFQSNRPYQPVLSNVRAENSDSLRSKLSPLKQKYGWRKDKPSVSQMAKACDLNEVYDYLYAATSRTVHFSPSVLFRMGWGPEQPDKPYTFSTSHFNGYYDSFNVFYGSYLFILLCDTIKSHCQFSANFQEIVGKIKKELNEWLRWPEMITFEEMNVPKPNILPYALSVVMSKEQAEKSRQPEV
ncbi:MAG: hypothetical protein HC890_07895 [Chloroflexaceae bacterium]|nr:hypothetical protein [Chloroflexaceae bacterium]